MRRNVILAQKALSLFSLHSFLFLSFSLSLFLFCTMFLKNNDRSSRRAVTITTICFSQHAVSAKVPVKVKMQTRVKCLPRDNIGK